MKDYKKIICLTAAVCLLGAAAFCGYHIYEHYAHEAEQTEAFENIAAIVEQAQTEDNDAPEVPLTEEENILTEYGELFLKNTDMVGWLSIAGTTFNYPVMQTPNEPNYYLKRNFEKEYSDLGTPYIQENCDLTSSDKDGMTFAPINGGKEYVQDTTYTSEIRISTLDCSNFTNPYQMLEYTENKLAEYAYPRISYVLSAMDLSVLTGYEHESWALGDIVTVDDKDLNLSVKTRVVRRQYNLQEPWNTVLELSTTLR